MPFRPPPASVTDSPSASRRNWNQPASPTRRQTGELSAQDEAVAEQYRKMLKMGMPDAAVSHKMSMNGVSKHIIDSVFPPQEAAPESGEAKWDVPQLSYEEEIMASKYRKMRSIGASDQVVAEKMFLDGVPELIQDNVLPADFLKQFREEHERKRNDEEKATNEQEQQQESSSQTVGLAEEEEIMKVKYEKMIKMGMPEGAVTQKMITDGVPEHVQKVVLTHSAVEEIKGPAALTPEEEEMKTRYSKMINMGMPEGAVAQKMTADGVPENIQQAVFSSAEEDKSPEKEKKEAAALTLDEEEVKLKYTKMVKMGMPEGAVAQKMDTDGVPEHVQKAVLASSDGLAASNHLEEEREKQNPPPLTEEEEAMKQKYKNMIKMGMPGGAVAQKMDVDGVPGNVQDSFLAPDDTAAPSSEILSSDGISSPMVENLEVGGGEAPEGTVADDDSVELQFVEEDAAPGYEKSTATIYECYSDGTGGGDGESFVDEEIFEDVEVFEDDESRGQEEVFEGSEENKIEKPTSGAGVLLHGASATSQVSVSKRYFVEDGVEVTEEVQYPMKHELDEASEASFEKNPTKPFVLETHTDDKIGKEDASQFSKSSERLDGGIWKETKTFIEASQLAKEGNSYENRPETYSRHQERDRTVTEFQAPHNSRTIDQQVGKETLSDQMRIDAEGTSRSRTQQGLVSQRDEEFGEGEQVVQHSVEILPKQDQDQDQSNNPDQIFHRFVFFIYALMVGGAVAVCLAFLLDSSPSGSRTPSGTETTRMGALATETCDFGDSVMPHVIDQCRCNGQINFIPEDVQDRYGRHRETLIPLIFQTYEESINACTARNQALVWLATANDYRYEDKARSERFALATFFIEGKGEQWTNADGWLNGSSACNWFGVSCSNGQVVGIELVDNGISGIIPPEIILLQQLSSITLSRNAIGGQIPRELFFLPRLNDLFLDDNQFSGSVPPFLQQATQLRKLAIQSNYLDGTLPERLDSLTALESLNLARNAIRGRLPSDLMKLPRLLDLQLQSNRFDGQLPISGLAEATSLRLLNLSSNLFIGSIPSTFGRMTSLRQLFLQELDVSGSLPDLVGDLGNLLELRITDTGVSGRVPTTIGRMSNLEILDLSGNALSNSIPIQLRSLGSTLRILDLSGNSLSSSVPTSLGELTNLVELRLDDNSLTGDIPATLGDLSLLVTLTLDGNIIQGEVPSELCDLRDELLEDLVVDCDALECEIPDCCTECRS